MTTYKTIKGDFEQNENSLHYQEEHLKQQLLDEMIKGDSLNPKVIHDFHEEALIQDKHCEPMKAKDYRAKVNAMDETSRDLGGYLNNEEIDLQVSQYMNKVHEHYPKDDRHNDLKQVEAQLLHERQNDSAPKLSPDLAHSYAQEHNYNNLTKIELDRVQEKREFINEKQEQLEDRHYDQRHDRSEQWKAANMGEQAHHQVEQSPAQTDAPQLNLKGFRQDRKEHQKEEQREEMKSWDSEKKKEHLMNDLNKAKGNIEKKQEQSLTQEQNQHLTR